MTGYGNPEWARTHSAAASTAPAVLALLRAGATCIGKTIMDEMAHRSVDFPLNLINFASITKFCT